MNEYKSGEWNAISKPCTVCKQDKSFDNYYKQSNGKYGLTSRCKSCHQASNRQWAKKNKESIAQKAKERMLNPLIKQKALQATNEWRKRNLDYDAERHRQRTALKQNAYPMWAEKDKIKLVYKKARELGLTVDHIVPLKSDRVCGLHVWNNLQLLDLSLNCAKRNLEWPHEWK